MTKLDSRSKDLRRNVIRMIEVDKRGHIGPALSLIEILRVLYDSFLKFQSQKPDWDDRDRLILSKGHGCLALYSILADKGFFNKRELDTFCQPDSILGGHPEKDKTPGVEASTGALGHGLPMGVGMALAARINNKNHRVVVIMGDGEINEGSVWESAMSAAKHKLSNLILFIDHNKLQSYGRTEEVLDMSPLPEKWKSFGFLVYEIDGHDINEIEEVLNEMLLKTDKPKVVICHTIKGKGLPFAEANPKWHHKSGLKNEDFEEMYKCLE